MSVWALEVILTTKYRYRIIIWHLITLSTSKFDHFLLRISKMISKGTFIRHEIVLFLSNFIFLFESSLLIVIYWVSVLFSRKYCCYLVSQVPKYYSARFLFQFLKSWVSPLKSGRGYTLWSPILVFSTFFYLTPDFCINIFGYLSYIYFVCCCCFF